MVEAAPGHSLGDSRHLNRADRERSAGDESLNRADMPLLGQAPMNSWWHSVKQTIIRHMSFIGPGLIAAVAYCDPGNWATDMEAGSRFGYRLLFTVLLSGLFAVLLQVLCCRLGTVTGMDLAVQTRRLVLRLPADSTAAPDWNAPWMRARYWGVLIPLYLINEGAIIATELAELIGSAIALNLLFPSVPLWGGVLITSADVFLILFLYRPSMSVRIFESFIGALVMIVLVCYIILLVRVQPDWKDVFKGYIPSHQLIESGGLYVSISILGATIMPHSLVLGSHFATIDRLKGFEESQRHTSSDEEQDEDDGCVPSSTSASEAGSRSRSKTPSRTPVFWRSVQKAYRSLFAKRIEIPNMVENDQLPSLPLVPHKHLDLSLKHASWDIAICLVLFAITINSAILIVASAAFYYGNNQTGDTEVVGDLFQAFALLRDTVGKAPAVLFAIALLTAGQSSSITVTLAGQIISEGFIHWRVTPFMRRLLTRGIAVIPSMFVAAIAGRSGLDQMLVASQVALSMALPFVSFPLLLLTRSRHRMKREVVKTETASEAEASSMQDYGATTRSSHEHPRWYTIFSSWAHVKRHLQTAYNTLCCSPSSDEESHGPTYFHIFSNSLFVDVLSWAVFLLICIADVYVLFETLKDPANA
ncbi:Manganese transporter smf1 [Malassezia yamatoensis]|uniref:Manganese transporter smf1 n=1 Tax=Malassezia yamatoensis TaxID=253288 RepID=A0AAJ6CGR4_9BASI|nr:Manganese transporter smf1 [Malassezia yamatoensis]